MLYTQLTIGQSHPMYVHMIPLLSEQERYVEDRRDQVIVLQGIKPIAHFFGIDAEQHARKFMEMLEQKHFFRS